MSIKIVSDSSSNVFTLANANYITVPMKVIAGDREFIDTPDLDLQEMVDYLKSYKGKSGSSCPNVQEWLDAFEGDDDIFALTISKNLSGSYSSACQAAEEFMQTHPGRKAFVFNTLTAGPQQILLAEKLRDLINEGLDYEAVKEQALDYQNHTHILFCLESMMNLARNGRVSPAVATIAGMLGIRAAGDVKGGQITPVVKPRGEKKAIEALVNMLFERGLDNTKQVRVAHCFGERQANALKQAVLARFPGVRFTIEPTTALCSFYAEEGGLMIGFEGSYNTNNNNKDF